MAKLPLTPAAFRRTLAGYTPGVERRIRDLNADLGEPATRREANAFFKRELSRLGLRFARGIDLGSNTGDFARAILARRCRDLVLVDFSSRALARARKALRGRPRTRFLRADLTRDWKKIAALGDFDLAALCEVIQHMPDPGHRRWTFVRAARLLRPGGILLFSHYARVPGEPAEGFFRSPRYRHLLYYHTAGLAEVRRGAREAGLRVLAQARTGPVNAFVMRKTDGRASSLLPSD